MRYLAALVFVCLFISAAFAAPWHNASYSTRYQAEVVNDDVYSYLDYPVNVHLDYYGDLSELLVVCNGSMATFGRIYTYDQFGVATGTDVNFRVNVPSGTTNDSCFIYYNATEAVSDQSSSYEPINWQFWYNFSEHEADWQEDWLGNEYANLTLIPDDYDDGFGGFNTTYVPSGKVVFPSSYDYDLIYNGTENTAGKGTRFFIYGFGYSSNYGQGLIFGKQDLGYDEFLTSCWFTGGYPCVRNMSFYWLGQYGYYKTYDKFQIWSESFNGDGATFRGDFSDYQKDGEYGEGYPFASSWANGTIPLGFVKIQMDWERDGEIKGNIRTADGIEWVSHHLGHESNSFNETKEQVGWVNATYPTATPPFQESGYFGLTGSNALYAAFGYSDLAENMTVSLLEAEQMPVEAPAEEGYVPKYGGGDIASGAIDAAAGVLVGFAPISQDIGMLVAIGLIIVLVGGLIYGIFEWLRVGNKIVG